MAITKARIEALVAKLEKVGYSEQPTLNIDSCKRVALHIIKGVESGLEELTPEKKTVIDWYKQNYDN